MSDTKPLQKHVLLLFSETGGGHRSAAEAIIEALDVEYGESVTSEMVDIFKDYAPLPFNRMPDWYPYMVKFPRLWGLSFKATNTRTASRAINTTFKPFVTRTARSIVRNHPSDVIVSVHPVGTTQILRVLGTDRPPFITVVTDMVSTHSFWFDKRSDLILVPTEMARGNALKNHMLPEKVKVVGQPVALRYCVPGGEKNAMREKLGWLQGKTTLLLVGGGEGMGPLARTAYAIDASGLDVALVVVAGRNNKLKAELESHAWSIPATIYGFTRDMPDFMRAADVLVTKAGPGTIAEALNAGLPIILYSRLPGQEDGNVTFVTGVGAGVWAPTAEKVVSTLQKWTSQPGEYMKAVEACRASARPDASRNIAREIGAVLKLSPQNK
jgi:1,2-diacylglycerol 3-beta-galactosyltransferase